MTGHDNIVLISEQYTFNELQVVSNKKFKIG